MHGWAICGIFSHSAHRFPGRPEEEGVSSPEGSLEVSSWRQLQVQGHVCVSLSLSHTYMRGERETGQLQEKRGPCPTTSIQTGADGAQTLPARPEPAFGSNVS